MLTPAEIESARKRAADALAAAGTVLLYVAGEATVAPRAHIADADRDVFTAWHEIVLEPGEQHTIPPDTVHRFEAGDEGAVVSEFSTESRDELDVFTDPRIRRATVVGE